MKKPVKKMKTWRSLKNDLLKKSVVRKAYEDTEVEYQIMRALLRARVDRNLTQKELAKRTGLHQSAIARFEKGAGNPTLVSVQKIARGLGVKIAVVK